MIKSYNFEYRQGQKHAYYNDCSLCGNLRKYVNDYLGLENYSDGNTHGEEHIICQFSTLHDLNNCDNHQDC